MDFNFWRVSERRMGDAQFMKIFGLILCLPLSLQAATYQDLKDKIVQLQTSASSLKSASSVELTQATELLNALSIASAPPFSATIGIAGAIPGGTVDLPIYFKSGDRDISAIQFDVQISSGLTVTSVIPGIATLAASKGVQGAPVPGGFRTLVFGLNQTSLPSGPIAILKLSVIPTIQPGKRIIPMAGVVASDPSGNSVPLAGRSGSITVR